MTVIKLRNDYDIVAVLFTEAKCVWFGENNQMFSEYIPENALRIRKEKDK